MLNKKELRELAYLVRVTKIEPIEGSDFCEAVVIGEWRVMVRKGTFKIGDAAVFFEIDSKVDPTNSAFEFLAKKDYIVKTQKYTFGGKGRFYSQGLLMSPIDFGWEVLYDKAGPFGVKIRGKRHFIYDSTRFLTKELKVTYKDPEDNVRKGVPMTLEGRAAAFSQKYKKFTKSHFGYWLMKHNLTRKIILALFAPKKKKSNWPVWVKKSDEERCQNMPFLFEPESMYQKVAFWWTEKIDGSSTTFTMRAKDKKLIVGSRNVAFVNGKENCYYDSNIYLEMAEKYQMERIMRQILKENPEMEWITIQAETYGEGVQKRNYSIKGHDMAVFNVLWKEKKTGKIHNLIPPQIKDFCAGYELPTVPIVGVERLPTTCDELLAAAAAPSKLDGLPREGVVLRYWDHTTDTMVSFKAVDNEFLLKYHN